MDVSLLNRITLPFKSLLVAVFVMIAALKPVKAQVSYNLWAVGSGISADNAVGGATESFFPLGGLSIEQLQPNGFLTNSTNLKFKIVAPEYWMFESGEGNISATSHFSAATINVTATEIEVTYSTTANMFGAKLDISGIKVKSTNPRNLEDGKMLYQPVNGNLSGLAPNTELGILKQKPGEVKKLMIFLPGEEYTQDPLVPTGKIGTPEAQIVGRPFDIEIRTVDEHYNTATVEEDAFFNITPINHTISFSSSDLDFVASNINLIDGIRTASVVMMNAGTHTITATNVTRPLITAAESTSFTVTKSAFANLLIVMPGETLSSSSPTGKTGTPTPQPSGTPFTATVYAADEYWIADNSVNGTVEITHTGANGGTPVLLTLVNGTGTVNINSTSSGNIVFTATYSANPLINNGVATVEIEPKPYTKILAFFDGQYHVPGSSTGIGGSAIIPDRAESIQLTILAVDDQFNLVDNIQNNLIFEPDDFGLMYDEDNFEYLEDYSVNYINGGYVLRFYVEELTPAVHTLTIRDTDSDLFTTVTIPLPSVPTAASDYFRTVQSGDWNNLGVWESSADNISWNPATSAPTTAASGVTIRTGHAVTVNNNIGLIDGADSSFDFIVEQGASLNLSANGQISFSKTSLRGTLLSNGGFESTTMRVYSTGIFTLNSNNALNIPEAVWDTGSVCNITGITSQSGEISGIGGRTLSTVNFNTPGLTGNVYFSGGALDITNLNIVNTGTTGTLRLANGLTAGLVSNIDSLVVTNGRVSLNNSSGGGDHTVNIQRLNFLNGTITKEGAAAATLLFNTTSPSFNIASSALFASALNVGFISGATINLASNEFKGSTGTFTISENSTVISSHPQGISTSGATGNIQFNTRTLPVTSDMTYHFNGETLQSTGNIVTGNFPPKLIIDNAVGAEMPSGGGNYIADNLEIRRGYFNLNGNRRVGPTSGPFTGPGELRIQNTTAAPIPAGRTWTGTIHFNGVNQSIVAGNYNNLTVSGGVKTVTGAINIAGNFDASGASGVTVGTHKVTYNGSGNQNVAGLAYYDLEIAGSGIKTITAPATLTRTLTVTNATTLNANGNLTLLATSNSNANIAPLAGGASITGNVSIQSYISGGRGTRTMSSPINDAATSGAKTFAQLKEQMIITGAGGAANGFDVVPAPAPDANIVFTYNNNLTPAFVPLSNISNSLNSGSGFIYFFMGNRDHKDSNPGKVLPPFVAAEAVTLTYTGVVNQGSIDIPISYNGAKTSMQGAFVAGNPYPSVIDWNEVYTTSNNIDPTITIVKAGQANATYNAAGGIAVNGGSRYIQPGQGFYVYAGSGGGTLSFREHHKNITEAPARLLSAKQSTQLLSAQGKKVSASKKSSPETSGVSSAKIVRMQLEQGTLREEAVVGFGAGFDAQADKDDSPYITGYDLNLATLSSDNKTLSINLMPEEEAVEEVKLAVSATNGGTFKLSFTDIPQMAKRKLVLKDKYLQTQMLVSSSDDTYEFAIDKKVSGSFGANRLALAFVPDDVLPVTFAEFEAKKQNAGAQLKWVTANETNNSYFEIEKSTDNLSFETIGTVKTDGNTTIAKSYYFVDKQPSQGNNYYRIKQVDRDGQFSYSAIKVLDFSGWSSSDEESRLTLYPNPVENEFTIDFHADEAVELIIVDMLGRKQGTVVYSENERIVYNAANLAAGIYIVELRGKNTGKLLGTAKLIKK